MARPPGWRGKIRTRSATGRIANRSGGLRSTASPSTPACRRRWPAAPRWCQCLGGGQALARGLDAHLGLYAPGGDRVGQCGVVAFGLVGVGLGEVGHGLVELV